MIEPAHLWIPPRLGSWGDEAVDLAADAGWDLDDEQKNAIDAHLSYGPHGRWVALEATMIEARQNGKTDGVLLPVAMFDLWCLKPDRMVWTAHLFRTARDAFNAFCLSIEHSATLSRRVKKISYGHGEESIELHNGALLEFLARSQGGGRGLKGKRVTMDEALVLGAAAMGALLPVLSTRLDAQVTYGSSGAKETSLHLHRLIKRGRRGGDPSLIHVEYCAPGSWEEPGCVRGAKCSHAVGTDGCRLDDETLWPHANHAVGTVEQVAAGEKRITYDYVRAERRALPAIEFGRERLGWHEALADELRPIPEKAWQDAVDVRSEALDPVALAVEVNNDRTFAAIAMAGRRPDGLIHIEVIKAQPGASWVINGTTEDPGEHIGTLAELWSPCVIVVDDKSQAASFLPDLKEMGLRERPRDPEREPFPDEIVVTTLAADLARACGQLHTAVTETKQVKHLNQPELNESVKGASWRNLADAKAWDRKNSDTDPTCLIAVTLALHGLVIYGPETGTTEMDGELMS